jgi:amidase
MPSILDRDTLGAFSRDTHVALAGAGRGPLAGLTFAAKDIFDVAGHPTGCGNPDWLRTHGPAPATAVAVQRLLDAGADLAGKAITEEMAWSIVGENAHYGAPVNPAAPGRVTGGSSSGSASAVAGGLVDFALGSDTGGSVRFPASLCGLIGLRPTHGRIPVDGVCALARSFDTVGWFARDPAVFDRVGRVLFQDDRPAPEPGPLLIATDAFAWAGDAVQEALSDAVDRVRALLGPGRSVDIAAEGFGTWAEAFRDLQSFEAWSEHGAWVQAVQPAFGPGVKERFAYASQVEPQRAAAARALRERVHASMSILLEERAVLMLPTAPVIAPKRGSPQEVLNAMRVRAIGPLCAAGFTGAPQISLPLATLEGCPLGLSLIAAPGEDLLLMDLAKRLLGAAA